MIPQDLAHVYLKGSVGDQFLSHPQAVASSRHLRHAAESELRHDLADLLRDKEHEPADVLRFSFEAAPQLFVLRSDADRAGVFGADAQPNIAAVAIVAIMSFFILGLYFVAISFWPLARRWRPFTAPPRQSLQAVSALGLIAALAG